MIQAGAARGRCRVTKAGATLKTPALAGAGSKSTNNVIRSKAGRQQGRPKRWVATVAPAGAAAGNSRWQPVQRWRQITSVTRVTKSVAKQGIES